MEEYKFLSFNYNTIITKDISGIHRYLIKESRYKIILGFIKKKNWTIKCLQNSNFSWEVSL